MNVSDTRYWIWYNCALHGRPRAAYEIYKRIGNIEIIYRFKESDYRRLGITNEAVLKALCDKDLDYADRQLWYAENYNVTLIPIDSFRYPEALKEISYPPVLLYVRGTHFEPQDEILVAMVGTRRCSEYGKKMSYEIACGLAELGVTVVSSMSSEIDVLAHQGCMSRSGKTIAVLGTGVNKAYPRGSKDLMLNIMNNGCVVSEYNFDGRTFATFFRERNRIITGLCKATIIVEAGARSGALTVAASAFEQNRDLFAVPGNAINPSSAGTNQLLKTCARPVTCADDIIQEYERIYPHLIKKKKYTAQKVEFDMPAEPGELEQQILGIVREFPKSADELARELRIDISAVNGAITMLEMSNDIKEGSDGKYVPV